MALAKGRGKLALRALEIPGKQVARCAVCDPDDRVVLMSSGLLGKNTEPRP